MDGLNWSSPRSVGAGRGQRLRGVAFGTSHFVAVGDSGAILQSDGILTPEIRLDIQMKPSALLVSAPAGLALTIQTSTDLISWRNLTNMTSAQAPSVIWDALPAASHHLFYRAYSK